jgi:hypothetical protein
MPNIKFNYLYRDGGNYKNYSSVIFRNPTNTDLAELEALMEYTDGAANAEFSLDDFIIAIKQASSQQ